MAVFLVHPSKRINHVEKEAVVEWKKIALFRKRHSSLGIYLLI
jgi:hypothetical protein